MKYLKYSIPFIFLFFIIAFSCDEIQEPFIEYNGQCGDASLPVPIKQILIEEFTGHECGNCPRGDEQIELIKSLYCDHVIPVSIHAGFFAQVNPTGKYTIDYRTTVGNEIDESFEGSVSVPAALINRQNVNSDYTFSVADWAGKISEILENEPVIDINLDLSYSDSREIDIDIDVADWAGKISEILENEPVIDINLDLSYSDSREIDIDIDVVFIKESDDALMLSLYFVEDSIKSWQKDYSLPAGQQDIESYSHNHVLRDAINGTWGHQITIGQVNANDVISKSYNYSIKPEWIIKNSSIIAFVYKSETKEILQASQIHL